MKASIKLFMRMKVPFVYFRSLVHMEGWSSLMILIALLFMGFSMNIVRKIAKLPMKVN